MYVCVTYDVSSTKKRNKVVSLLESYGFRVQKSVFEIELTESQYRILKKQLNSILTSKRKTVFSNENPETPQDILDEDSIKFYILSKVWEGNLDGRIDGVWNGYQKVYFEDFMIL